MQNKLQELTEKIYQEGLEKGNEEANSIIEKAKKDASAIIESAKKQAEEITSVALKKAEETKTNTESEIKLSSKQALNALKHEITNIINDKIVGEATKNSFDTTFTKQIVEITLKNWSKAQTENLAVLLPESEKTHLHEVFKKSIKDLLDKGLELKFESVIKSGFQIAPKDGSYKVSFTEEDFNNFFKQYLRPKLIEILFE